MAGNFVDIVNKFNIQGTVVEVTPFGSGHINDSYRAQNSDTEAPNYFLQRINHHVFRDVEGMMQNIQRVTQFLADIYRARNEGYDTLTIVKTKEQGLYTQHNGQFWRLYLLIEGLKSIDKPDSPQLVYEGAKGYGEFIRDLTPFNAASLNITIPWFHHMPRRLSRLQEVVNVRNSFSREEQFEIDFVNQEGNDMCMLQRLLDRGSLPLRVTHNDTKFNNILFDRKNKAKCVIDLDTVMPGLVHFDYGDGVRTGCSTTEEDESDLSEVDMDMEAFEAYTHGFLDATRSDLSETEIATIVEGALMMTFIMGVRFLTDHLEGNKYYKIAYEGHNLVRARCQLELTRKMLDRKAELVSIAKKYT